MEGGMIQNTVKHLKRIGREQGREQGIQTMAKELKEIGIEEEKIREAIIKTEKEIQKL